MRVTRSQIVVALERNAGIIALAARDLGISRQALHQRIQRSEHLQLVCEQARETRLDVAEATLVKAITAGDIATARWELEQQGGSRGYGKRLSITSDAPSIDIPKTLESLDAEQLKFLQSLAASGRARGGRNT